MLCTDDGLDNEIFDAFPNQFLVDTMLGKMLPQGAQSPLMALSDLGIVIMGVAGTA